jgi:putative membrane protein
MNLNRMRIIMLSTATMLFPIALLAQAEPGSMPETMGQNSQSQPGQPGLSNSPQPGPAQQNARLSSQDSVGNNGETPQTMKDKMFLRQAAEGNLAEVQLGQLATQKATNDDVKAFGQKMVDDHTALNKDLEPLADSIGVMLPKHMNKADQAEYDKLKGLSGDEFDTEYLTLMVKEHHKDLREFRLETADTQDSTLRETVMKGQRVIHGHMVAVDELAKSRGIAIPAHRGGRNPAPPPPAE